MEHYEKVLLLCSVFGVGLEISDIPLKPVSFLLKRMGKVMNEDIHKEVKGLDSKFNEFKKKYDIDEIARIRQDISEFTNSCQRHERHSESDFDRIFEQIGRYHTLLELYGLTNGKIDIETKYIESVYQKCLSENKFFIG